MSIFIKGLNVPNKYPVKVIINPTGAAFVDYGPYFETLEAVGVPAPHGRLIDADALYEQTAEWEAKALAQVEKHDPRVENQTRGWAHWSVVLVERTAFKYDIADMPTIIEAEEGEEA